MKKIHVSASGEYDVIIEPGLLDTAGERLAEVTGRGATVAVVAGETVFALYGARLIGALEAAGFRTVCFTYPGGEQCKTLDTYTEILRFLSRAHISRSDIVAALGGGVTGDMAGFAAATYQRGIRYVQIPTTVLAAVDSSVGGKTAVNLDSGKNQVGCFYQPCAVLCDTRSFDTLPMEQRRSGYAEIIKYGMLDEELFEELERVPIDAQLEHIVARCVGIKRDIVAEDEFDTGRRMLLNLGHSVGHAIEKCSGYTVPHGYAVAAGMAVITRAAEKRGTCAPGCTARLEALLKAYSLPAETEYIAGELATAMLADKKVSSGRLRLVVPERVGFCRITPVEFDELTDWLHDGGVA